jgi:hypothetical protein
VLRNGERENSFYERNSNFPKTPQWSLACNCSPGVDETEIKSVQASCRFKQHSDCDEKNMRSKRQAAAKAAFTRWRALKFCTVSQVLEREEGDPIDNQANVEEMRKN